jgi:hypothetical protein
MRICKLVIRDASKQNYPMPVFGFRTSEIHVSKMHCRIQRTENSPKQPNARINLGNALEFIFSAPNAKFRLNM